MSEDEQRHFQIPEEDAGERLDKAVARLVPDMSRGRLQALIAEGRLSGADGPVTEASHRLKGGEAFTLSVPPPVPAEPEPQEIPLDLIFEDEHLLIVNKPAGLVVHPAPGNREGTLVNAVLAHCGDELPGINGVERPGIVHRIDKDTSGLLVVAKTEPAQISLQKQFAAHTIERQYTAYVWGIPRPATGTIEGDIGRSPTNRRKMAIVTQGGRHALTHYDLDTPFKDMASRLTCTLETGRTHQIRVHLTTKGHPLLGDPLYGKGRQTLRRGLDESLVAAISALPGQALHAGFLGISHPISGEDMSFEAPLPDYLQELDCQLRAFANTHA